MTICSILSGKRRKRCFDERPPRMAFDESKRSLLRRFFTYSHCASASKRPRLSLFRKGTEMPTGTLTNAVQEKPRVGLCSIPAAAEFLSVSRGKMYSMLNSGECPSKRYGKSVRIPWAWLHAQAEVASGDESGVSQ